VVNVTLENQNLLDPERVQEESSSTFSKLRSQVERLRVVESIEKDLVDSTEGKAPELE
jgi:hypothetical protein